MKNLKLIAITFLLPLFINICEVNAQSLPTIQKVSVRAPANLKIDGKATEWGDKFQANNKATDVYYTLSNDDENLYLVVQSKLLDVSNKILMGSITLTINHTLSKHDMAAMAITYPDFEGNGRADAANMLARKENEKRDAKDGIISVDDMNKLMDAKSKTIKTYGVKAITDNVISVYNQEGLKAAAQFDKDLAYTYELAIPLKYLALPNNGADGFTYNIKINGPDEKPVPHTSAPGPPMPMTATAPTDFWGEYTLAKK